MTRIRNKIRRTREQFIYYHEILSNLCFPNKMEFLIYSRHLGKGLYYGTTKSVYHICLYKNNSSDGNRFIDDDTKELYLVYRTREYGNDLNAYGDAIRWIERKNN